MPTLTLHIPTQDEATFQSLPADCLADIYRKHTAVSALLCVKGKKGMAGVVAKAQAAMLGMSVSRFSMLASAFKKTGWKALWNRSLWPSETSRPILPREFLKHWESRVLHKDGGGSIAQIHSKLLADWRYARRMNTPCPFPGYEHTPEPEHGTHIPRGWSYGNLLDFAPDAASLKLAWEGAGAFRGVGPQVRTDRKTIEVGARLMIDDYDWNQHVIFHTGGRPEPIRVNQLGILDVRSGALASVFFKPIYQREDGTKDNIKQDHTLLLLCAHLFNYGYIPGVTQLALEKGTAGLHPRLRESFTQFAPGLTFDDAGSRERHQVNGHGGKDRTNPNKKAAVESLHHLLTNIEASGPANTGANYTQQPEAVHGLMKEVKWLLSKVSTNEQLALLKLGVLSFEDFLPWARSIVATVNARRNHSLQGFPTMLHYRASIDSEDWLTAGELLALPQPSQLAIADGVRELPAIFCARVKQSPNDVFTAGLPGLTRLSAWQACHLAASVVGQGTRKRVVRSRRLHGAYFEISESRLAYLSEPLVFEARILTKDGSWQELRDGQEVELVFNPMDESSPRKCFVRDERGGFLGIAIEAVGINPNDKEELLEALCHRSERTAERTADVRAAFATDRERTKADKAHNRRVLNGEPVTAAEKQTARRNRSDAREAREALTDYVTTTTTTNNEETTPKDSFE